MRVCHCAFGGATPLRRGKRDNVVNDVAVPGLPDNSLLTWLHLLAPVTFDRRFFRFAISPLAQKARRSAPTKEGSLRRIAVHRCTDFFSADGLPSCLALNRAGIRALVGMPGSGGDVIWIEEDSDTDRALTLLRARGFEVKSVNG